MREFGSEHPAIMLPDGYFESLNHFGREVTYLRSGREALLYAGKNACDALHKKILIPAYCCWSMSAPFKDWEVIYYPLNEDLTIDETCLAHLLQKEHPQAVLTMNFFGSASTTKAIKRIKLFDGKIQVIEDFSHCTFCINNIYNKDVDYYVSSIRKSIGVCDGSVVLSKVSTNHAYIASVDANFADQRFVAQTDKMFYTWSKDQDNKQTFLNTIRECEGIINDFDTVRPISARSLQMLKMVNGKEIAYARQQNMKHLWTLLQGKVNMVQGLERSFEGAPFSLPILVENRDEVQTALAKRGVYTQLLWPIDSEAQQICQVAKKMNDMMLSVPIDQRYSWDDIEDIASIILDVCQQKNY